MQRLFSNSIYLLVLVVLAGCSSSNEDRPGAFDSQQDDSSSTTPDDDSGVSFVRDQDKAVPTYSYRTDLVKEPYDHSASWPTDAAGLCRHMNNTDQLELEAMNEPERFPDYLVSGQTRGIFQLHEKLLNELGYSLSWNPKTKQFDVVPLIASSD